MSCIQTSTFVLALVGGILGGLLARAMGYGTVGVVIGGIIGLLGVHTVLTALFFLPILFDWRRLKKELRDGSSRKT